MNTPHNHRGSVTEVLMFKGASIVFITQTETRLIGILGFLAAAALSGWEWHRRNRAGKA